MNAARKDQRTRWSATPRPDPARLSNAALRESLFRRVEEFLRESMARMSDSELLAVVEAPTASESIARVIAASPHVAVERDDWTQALLRGALVKQDALRAAGGVLSSGEVA